MIQDLIHFVLITLMVLVALSVLVGLIVAVLYAVPALIVGVLGAPEWAAGAGVGVILLLIVSVFAAAFAVWGDV